MENKTGKYFKYAIGEIILVVIGILIALAINNWNENRKEKESLNAIYDLVISDLESDKKAIAKILKYNESKSPLLNHVIKGNLNKEDYDTNSTYYNLINGSEGFTLKTKGYEQLRSFNESDFFSDALQITINDFYELYNQRLEGLNEVIFEDLKSNYNYWKENFNWYPDYLIEQKSEEFITYSINNMDYKNRVANYYYLNCILLTKDLEKIQIEATKILSLLKERNK
ncbi:MULTISPECIES: DUF6090 family protein [unclassified Winogradskyella]|jgi:hypothetical protein|nr:MULTISPECIES: DUF6090 family protein [unclassified Winogradskyella]